MHDIIFAFFLIFFGAAVLSTIALFTRQSLLVAYIILGMLVGPWGFKFIDATGTINEISTVGIMFLLFLLGMNLPLSNLIKMLRGATIVTVVSSVIFALISLIICHYFGFSWLACIIVGLSLIFSSTIIALKLLPTTALHHQHIGEVVISILLLQDMIAILVLLVINFWSAGGGGLSAMAILKTLIGMPLLVVIGFLAERYVLFQLFRRFDRIKEYLFLLSIGWCLGLSELANWFGLSYEIGAFIAGVSLAACPISAFIAESLKPLRDFFLIVFFFSVGAGFNFHLLPELWAPVLVLALVVLLLKPLVYRFLLREVDESPKTAWEIGFRLGQASEFSLLVAFLAFQAHLIAQKPYVLIQAVTILTFVVSAYIVVWYYPSPLAIKRELRRD